MLRQEALECLRGHALRALLLQLAQRPRDGPLQRLRMAVVRGEGLRMTDRKQDVAVFRGRLRREEPGPPVHEVRGGDRVTVRPARALPQMERVAESIGRNVPALR